MATKGPPPTILLSFSELHQSSVGDKVRFLGCVAGYNTKTGEITLQHKFQDCRDKTVLVDVNLLLETLNMSLVRIGEWVNIIGYVTKQESKLSHEGKNVRSFTSIQAIIYWSAGAIKIDEYESTISETQVAPLAA